jgi:hypothetical protein
MEVVRPTPIELDAFRRRTRPVYDKWANVYFLDDAQAWDGRRVLARLRAAFVASPGLAVYSRSPTHFERIAEPVTSAMLLAAVTAVLDRSVPACGGPARIALLERTRAETITELCDAKGWHPARFYRRTDAAAERVAAYLNEHDSGGRCRPREIMDAVQYNL